MLRLHIRQVNFNLSFGSSACISTDYSEKQNYFSMQVHSTIENAILPSATQYGSSDDVLSWLDQTLTAIWVDPVCGDGVCETPFEYASYGRFGCRADCGKLSEIQNLTTLQIDLYFDFTHPTTSIASSVSNCCRILISPQFVWPDYWLLSKSVSLPDVRKHSLAVSGQAVVRPDDYLQAVLITQTQCICYVYKALLRSHLS